MIDLFDYSKHSVHEYNNLLARKHLGEDVDIHFKLPITGTENYNTSLRIKFTDGIWIDVYSSGWKIHRNSNRDENIAYEYNYYNKPTPMTREEISLGDIQYRSNINSVLEHKKVFIKNSNAYSYDNKLVRLSHKSEYTFNVEIFKKYKEYQLHTDTGMSYYEKVSNTNGVLSTSLRVQNKNKDKYSISISRNTKTKQIEFILTKNFKRGTVHKFYAKDASIDTIFNKYTMIEFDLTADPEEYEIISELRELLESQLKDLYNVLKKKKANTTVIWNVLKRLELIQNDEYQIQRRKA